MTDSRGAHVRPRSLWARLDIAAAFVLPLLVVVLFWQWFDVYFTLGGPAPEPSGHEVARYRITGGLAATVWLAGLVIGIVRLRGRAILGYLAMGTLLIPVLLVFAVPSIDVDAVFRQEPEPLSSNYCSRTDSENCPGG